MGIILSSIKTLEALEAGLTSIRDDLDLDFVVSALHQDVFALKDAGTAATIANLVNKIDTIQVSTKTSQPESTILGNLFFDMMPWIDIERYYSLLTATDNIPHAFGWVFPLSPFPNDLTRNFGAKPGVLLQYVINTAADVSQDFDGYVHDLIAEGLTVDVKPNSLGHMKTLRDVFTSGAVDSIEDTKIQGKRLLATMNFQTTAFDDLAAAAAFDVTGIRNQAVAFSDDIKFGPYRPSYAWTRMGQHREVISGTAGVGNQLDLGHFLIDYGWMNDAPELGINIDKKEIKIKTVAGVASETTEVNPWALIE